MTIEEKRDAIEDYCRKQNCGVDGYCKLYTVLSGKDIGCYTGITDEQLEANYAHLFGDHTSEIEHPSHYAGEKYECIEVMREVFGNEAVNSFCLCNAFKYLWRCNKKHDDATTDLKKARYYIDHLINHLGGA